MKVFRSVICSLVIFSFTVPALAQTYSIGTSPQGSLFYSAGAALSTVMVQKTGAQYRIAPYGGSSTFLPLVDKGELAFGLANGGESAFAYDGVEIFQGTPKKNLRMVGAFYKNLGGFGVQTDSPYKTIADLKGKRIPSDYPSGRIFHYLAEAILAAAGLTHDDFRKVPVPNQVDGVDAFAQGRVDSAYIPLNQAAGKKAMASMRGGWRFVTFDSSPAAQKKATVVLPSCRIELLKPAKEYEGVVADPTAMIVVDFYIVAGAHVSDEAVYTLVKTMSENKPNLANALGTVFNYFDPKKMALQHPVPYHPGAIKFYKEAGIWKGGI
jgi:TRAP transporter TAXI family solute receptor